MSKIHSSQLETLRLYMPLAVPDDEVEYYIEKFSKVDDKTAHEAILLFELKTHVSKGLLDRLLMK